MSRDFGIHFLQRLHSEFVKHIVECAFEFLSGFFNPSMPQCHIVYEFAKDTRHHPLSQQFRSQVILNVHIMTSFMFSVCKVSIFFCSNKEIMEKSWIADDIKNTHHSSGLGVNAKSISNIEPDEWWWVVKHSTGCYLLIVKRLGRNMMSDEWNAKQN